nr:hypothetical transcript [Hymenolepis microstoma]
MQRNQAQYTEKGQITSSLAVGTIQQGVAGMKVSNPKMTHFVRPLVPNSQVRISLENQWTWSIFNELETHFCGSNTHLSTAYYESNFLMQKSCLGLVPTHNKCQFSPIV